MMTLENTKETSATSKPAKFSCEFCNREFARERTLISHLCETKQRWLNKDIGGNRLGFQAWLQFYAKNSMSKTKNKTYAEFIRSPYYLAFVKFGTYCVDVKVINLSMYVDWLLKNAIKLDVWATDSIYNRFLCEYLRIEDAFDAIHRSVKYCIDLAEKDNIQPNDVLRYVNPNRICHAVTLGKISPWLLYCSDSGIQFIETLNQDHVNIINDYINPQQWALKFHREPDVTRKIRDTLKDAGY